MRRTLRTLAYSVVLAAAAGMALFASSGSPTGRASGQEAAPVLETIKLSGNQYGNYCNPGVAENLNGDRLAIFRGPGPDFSYRYKYYSKKKDSWTTEAAVIPNPPSMEGYFRADIEADSTGRFHCVWEETHDAAVYASYLDGSGWTQPIRVFGAGTHEYGVSIGVRSNDQVVINDTRVLAFPYLTKDIFVWLKGKTENQFNTSYNVTADEASSAQSTVAIAPNDHIWIAYKHEDDPGPPEILVTRLIHLDENNRVVEKRIVSTDDKGTWCFWPSIAVNNEGKVMSAWAQSTATDYYSRLYDPATGKMSDYIRVNSGLSMQPWNTFFSMLVAHGKDFYLAVLSPARLVFLYKFDETKSEWTDPVQMSNLSCESFDLYSGYDKIMVAWAAFSEPQDVYLTTLAVEPLLPKQYALTVQSGSGGTTNPAPGTYNYDRDSNVNITAFPDTAFRLKNWSGDASGTTNPLAVKIDKDKTVKANFEYILQPAVGVATQKKLERSFFRGYYMNVVTWQENPLNVAQNVTIVEQRLYRKTRAADNSQWALLASLGPSTMTYTDMNVGKDSDYVYSVGLVDDKGNVSSYY